eukprot:CAMPEP_0118962296 /NCGR_PEP_ID=MMETSP1173-20130426/691_1 /TAXON_ID=1034831 /ORGANISM="Rhizochromulina marina cf, Strain CCMP1243" /LENGTH=51 /DNA_ID=CAMNT_0006910545 /DNA_START=64 /DNA_END=215 /DNA_ORIENTATION=-
MAGLNEKRVAASNSSQSPVPSAGSHGVIICHFTHFCACAAWNENVELGVVP